MHKKVFFLSHHLLLLIFLRILFSPPPPPLPNLAAQAWLLPSVSTEIHYSLRLSLYFSEYSPRQTTFFVRSYLYIEHHDAAVPQLHNERGQTRMSYRPLT